MCVCVLCEWNEICANKNFGSLRSLYIGTLYTQIVYFIGRNNCYHHQHHTHHMKLRSTLRLRRVLKIPIIKKKNSKRDLRANCGCAANVCLLTTHTLKWSSTICSNVGHSFAHRHHFFPHQNQFQIFGARFFRVGNLLLFISTTNRSRVHSYISIYIERLTKCLLI